MFQYVSIFVVNPLIKKEGSFKQFNFPKPTTKKYKLKTLTEMLEAILSNFLEKKGGKEEKNENLKIDKSGFKHAQNEYVKLLM